MPEGTKPTDAGMELLSEQFPNPQMDLRPLQIVHGFDWYSEKFENAGDIERALLTLRGLGVGGVVANVSWHDYLESREHWELLNRWLLRAADLGFQIWIYDEKGYPSGSAGGHVLKGHPEHEALGIACYSQTLCGPTEAVVSLPPGCREFVWWCAYPLTGGSPSFSQPLHLNPRPGPSGAVSFRVPEGEWMLCTFAERRMYEGTHAAGNAHASRRYINVMDREAVRRFIEHTHERYLRELDSKVWSSVKAFFTDEPSFMTAYIWPLPDSLQGKAPIEDPLILEDRPPALPWTADFPAAFASMKGYDLLPNLPKLFFGNCEDAGYVRQDYHEVITALYSDAYFGQIASWCDRHLVSSSGHVMAEESVAAHAAFQGSIFATLQKMHIPGIDILTSRPGEILGGSPFMTAKLASSVAHVYGADQVMSETSDWVQRSRFEPVSANDARGTANVLYALGVNTIASYYPWQGDGESYRAYCDHVGRLGTMLRGGRHVCDVAILYPIRSVWASFQPSGDPFPAGANCYPEAVSQLDTVVADAARTLLRHQIDFDFVDEESIISSTLEAGRLGINQESYGVVILPFAEVLQARSFCKLRSFADDGGMLVALGAVPRMGSSEADTRELRELSDRLFFNRQKSVGSGVFIQAPGAALLNLVKRSIRPRAVVQESGEDVLHLHRRREGLDIHFVVNVGLGPASIRALLPASGSVSVWRPLTGQIEELLVEESSGETGFRMGLEKYEGVCLVCASQPSGSGTLLARNLT